MRLWLLEKVIAPSKLAQLLGEIPDKYMVSAQTQGFTGNLVILDVGNSQSVGVIDVANERVGWWKTPIAFEEDDDEPCDDDCAQCPLQDECEDAILDNDTL